MTASETGWRAGVQVAVKRAAVEEGRREEAPSSPLEREESAHPLIGEVVLVGTGSVVVVVVASALAVVVVSADHVVTARTAAETEVSIEAVVGTVVAGTVEEEEEIAGVTEEQIEELTEERGEEATETEEVTGGVETAIAAEESTEAVITEGETGPATGRRSSVEAAAGEDDDAEP